MAASSGQAAAGTEEEFFGFDSGAEDEDDEDLLQDASVFSIEDNRKGLVSNATKTHIQSCHNLSRTGPAGQKSSISTSTPSLTVASASKALLRSGACGAKHSASLRSLLHRSNSDGSSESLGYSRSSSTSSFRIHSFEPLEKVEQASISCVSSAVPPKARSPSPAVGASTLPVGANPPATPAPAYRRPRPSSAPSRGRPPTAPQASWSSPASSSSNLHASASSSSPRLLMRPVSAAALATSSESTHSCQSRSLSSSASARSHLSSASSVRRGAPPRSGRTSVAEGEVYHHPAPPKAAPPATSKKRPCSARISYNTGSVQKAPVAPSTTAPTSQHECLQARARGTSTSAKVGTPRGLDAASTEGYTVDSWAPTLAQVRGLHCMPPQPCPRPPPPRPPPRAGTQSPSPPTRGSPSKTQRRREAPEASCSICLDPLYRTGHPDSQKEEGCVYALPCGHAFHSGCIERWLKVSSTCPLCKTSVQPPSRSDSPLEVRSEILAAAGWHPL
eukprot:gnl/TRDRNA2_/TRDRNA2_137080_c0_seq1.p1 gnl/TRDRNA2_/TRDRNA2_137080_c0~~gnl/TRDRNA2_/TRDRNA2_137080_c0_seq1.p1  ORF type:complete len:504 (-),score=34.66 gnl/TRDRNA2_/TRDRNA2_137080_c0_seq1:34-1545(-)